MKLGLAGHGMSDRGWIWESARNLARTVWEPTRADVGQGVNVLLSRALDGIDPKLLRGAEREMPAVAALFAEKFNPDLDLERLERPPDGTLGREYARFMRDNGIVPIGDLLHVQRTRTRGVVESV